MSATTNSHPRQVGVPALLWGALALELVQLLLVLLLPDPPPWLPGERLPPVDMFVRAVIAPLVLPAVGLLPALFLLRVRSHLARSAPHSGEAPPLRARDTAVGLFTLLAVSLGCGLLLYFGAALTIRLFRPLSAMNLSLVALGVGAVGILLGGRYEGCVVRLEPGLSRWPLVLALAITVGFAVVARVRLFGGPRRMVPLTGEVMKRLEEVDRAAVLPPDFVSGVRQVPGVRRYVVPGVSAELIIEGPKKDPRGVTPHHARIVFVVTAAPGTVASLWQVPAEACHAKQSTPTPEREVARVTVQKQVLGVDIATVMPRFNALLVAAPAIRAGPNCFQLRFEQRNLRLPTELADIGHLDLGRRDLLDSWLILATENEIECHVADLRYHDEMRRENVVSHFLLLWACLIQTVAEVMSGAQYPVLGIQFLLLALFCLGGAMVLVGAIRDPAQEGAPPSRRWSTARFLLLGPFLLQLHSLTYAHVHSFAFPDTPFTAFLVGALALLLLHQRAGFILLGCMAALSRYPGAYILMLTLVGYVLFMAHDRRWGVRTLLWALGLGLVMGGAFVAYWGATVGLRQMVGDIYFEVFPEHFEVLAAPTPLGQRMALFFGKLLALSAGTLTLWPLALRLRPARVLMLATLGYAVTLMAVHIPHAHYFPVLVYFAVAVGVGGVASSSRFPAWAAAAIVLAGTAVGLNLERIVQ